MLNIVQGAFNYTTQYRGLLFFQWILCARYCVHQLTNMMVEVNDSPQDHVATKKHKLDLKPGLFDFLTTQCHIKGHNDNLWDIKYLKKVLRFPLYHILFTPLALTDAMAIVFIY